MSAHARHAPCEAEAESGFSLIEVLVTLTILAGLMAALTPLASRMLHSWAMGARQANRSDEVATAIDQLRRDIGGAFPYVIEGSDPPKLRFSGSPQGFTLVTRAGGGPEVVSVAAVASGEAKPSLLRGSRSVSSLDGGTGRETRVALLSSPLSARFAYRSRKGGKRDVWDATTEMPVAIEVTFLDRGRALFGGPVPLAIYTTIPIVCVVAAESAPSLCPNGAGDPASAGEQASGQTAKPSDDKPSFGANGKTGATQ